VASPRWGLFSLAPSTLALVVALGFLAMLTACGFGGLWGLVICMVLHFGWWLGMGGIVLLFR